MASAGRPNGGMNVTGLREGTAKGGGRIHRDASPALTPASQPAGPAAPAEPRQEPAPPAEAGDRPMTLTGYARSTRGQAANQDPMALLSMIPDGWVMIAPVLAVTAVMLGMALWQVPGRAVIALALAAVVLALCGRPLSRFERHPRRPMLLRYAAMTLAVAAPMLAFGSAIALWRDEAPWGPPLLTVGSLAIVALVAAVTLSGRPPTLVAANTALWLPLAVETGSRTGYATMLLGVLVGIVTAVRQMGIDRAAQAEQLALRRVQLRAEEILEDYEQTGQGWFWETDRKGQITYVSPPIGRLLERDLASLIGRPLTELFILGSGRQEGERTLHFHLNARSSFQELTVRAACSDERWWSINGRPIYDTFNNFLGFRGSGSDLTEKRRSEQHATRLAHFDSLTGLANRFQMSQTLEKILNAPHQEHRACAVFLLDLDRFKQVNDTMGHPVGDALLKQVAQRLENTVGQAGRVGRLGGDEFQVILPGRIGRQRLADLAMAVIEQVSQPYSIEGSRVVIGASIGVALSPDDGVTSEAIIRNADLALYAAKDRGRGVHHFYDADLHSDAEERRQLEHDLRDAVTQGGLELHYQPVVHTTTEKITGLEALLRWTHPVKGPISPAKFVPIAEETGLIAQIGEWALRTACHDLATWPERVRVAVNVSSLQFANPALPAIVTSALAAAQVDPARLELEITESVFLGDNDGTEAMFAALKAIGVRLALDDFGTGYSSLGYLKRAPFDKIKIDQSFVRGATMPGSRNGAIIAAIVSLAEALDMETTAEGVETLDELSLIRELGCSHVQGYIYSKSLDAVEARACLVGDLSMEARGPSSARPQRRSMLRKIGLEYQGQLYPVTVRNVSATGAMIDSAWNIPAGLDVLLVFGNGQNVPALTRWSEEGRAGLQFHAPVQIDESGPVVAARVPGLPAGPGGAASVMAPERRAG